MKAPRLLFLAYHHAPVQAVASIRGTYLPRALAGLGWSTRVLTIDDAPLLRRDDTLPLGTDVAGLSIIRCPHRLRFLNPSLFRVNNRGLARLLGGSLRVAARRLHLEVETGWRFALNRALGAIRPDEYDLILATGGPWLAHDLAARHAARLGIPLVLDYRDLRAGNDYAPAFLRPAELRREARARALAQAIVAVSPSLLAHQDTLFPPHAHTAVVANGYGETSPIPARPRADQAFTLLYAGQFYPPDRTFEPFMRAFELLQKRLGPTATRLRYLGPSAEHVRATLADRPANPAIHCEGPVGRAEALAALAECDVALVSCSNRTRTSLPLASIVTGKIFEIIAARKPYLVVAPLESDVRAVVEIAGGGRVFVAEDTEGIAGFLADVRRGRAPAFRDPSAYSWPSLGKKIDGILRAALARHRGGSMSSR